MKAIIFDQYGPPETLHLESVDKPVPGTHEVLVRIYAAAINSWDWELLHGVPFANRVSFGLFRPTRIRSLGCDIAGVVESVGSRVEGLAPGDEVFGDLSHCGWGGFAEYTVAPESALTIKPSTLSLTEAAAAPQAALLAFQGLHDKGLLQAGERVLINGASGGAGTFAIQLAKLIGAEVTGTCRTSKMELVHTLGADHVIDYTREDVTRSGRHYDLILDMQAHHSPFAYRQALAPRGRYVAVGGITSVLMQTLLLGPLLSRLDQRSYALLLHRANSGLGAIAELLANGKVKAVIDRIYPLEETAAALRYYGDGHARGKVVVSVASAC